jgi:Trk K+ transport system NAD-binding subunit
VHLGLTGAELATVAVEADPHTCLAGRPVSAGELRQQFELCLLAVGRGAATLQPVTIDMAIEPGDTLYVFGQPARVAQLRAAMQAGVLA